MRRSGLADSPFFPTTKNDQATTPLPIKPPTKTPTKAKGRTHKSHAAQKPTNQDAVTPRNRETTVSRYHDTIIELVRKAVKQYGKEAATHRFTQEEKKAIADIIYGYKNRRIRTSENEITRIAVNFIVNDHKENGENSILARTLRALNE